MPLPKAPGKCCVLHKNEAFTSHGSWLDEDQPLLRGSGNVEAPYLLHCGHRPTPPSGYNICCRVWQDMACATSSSATMSGAQRECMGAPCPADMLWFPALGLSAEYWDLGTPQAHLLHDERGPASTMQTPPFIPPLLPPCRSSSSFLLVTLGLPPPPTLPKHFLSGRAGAWAFPG